ncbi:MAG: 30S ribosomal protein S8, partial [Desulfobacteraceae bacterium]
MSMSDPIADMLTRIRNGIMASYDTVDIPTSKLKINIAKILKSEGFIKNYKIIPDRRQGIIRIFLKYDDSGDSIIGGIKRVSKPSARIYAKSDKI